MGAHGQGSSTTQGRGTVDRPLVGVGVIVVRNEKVLLGLRRGSHGAGSWAPPGGHLELGEEPAACAARELFEETGLVARNIRAGPYTNDIYSAQKHYITLYFVVDAQGEPQVLEPYKCERWEWFAWNALPDELFLSFAHLVESKFNLSSTDP